MFGRCKDCDSTLARLAEMEDQIEKFQLDYELLYEKTRVGLSRLARLTDRAEAEASAEVPDDGLDPVSRRIKARRSRAVPSRGRQSAADEG